MFYFSSLLNLDVTRGSPLTQLAMLLAETKVKDGEAELDRN